MARQWNLGEHRHEPRLAERLVTPSQHSRYRSASLRSDGSWNPGRTRTPRCGKLPGPNGPIPPLYSLRPRARIPMFYRQFFLQGHGRVLRKPNRYDICQELPLQGFTRKERSLFMKAKGSRQKGSQTAIKALFAICKFPVLSKKPRSPVRSHPSRRTNCHRQVTRWWCRRGCVSDSNPTPC